MNKKHLVLFFIILFAAFLRLYLIDQIPPGINRDEASIGYTAYSILTSGRDEYGRLFPISFQSFGDWKLPFYIYTVVPMVAIFGLNELAVRLPSALFGIACVALTFFLVRSLFKNTLLAFLTTFLIAVSPWHIHLSRVESESNTAVFFVILGVTLFLKSINEKERRWLIIPSSICFALTYYIYAGNYIFTTLLIIGILLIYREAIPKTKYLYIGITTFFILSGFIWYHTFFANQTKVSGINIFGDPAVVHAKIELPRNEHEDPDSLISRMAHNRLVFAVEKMSQNYISAFSSQFLFIKGGDNKAHNISNFGNMYLIEAPFLLLGFFYLLKMKKTKEIWLVLWWFFIAPVSASITKDAPHTNRMFAIFPILPLVTALGMFSVYQFIEDRFKKQMITYFALSVAFVLFLVNFLIYLDRYFVHFPRNEAVSWGVGYKELEKVLSQEKYASKQIVMTHPEYSHYIFLVFYSKYDPLKYQTTAIRYPLTEDGFVHVKKFDRFEFRDIDWGADTRIANRLLIDDPSNIPEFVKNSFPTFDIELPNGEVMFKVIETK